VLIKDFAEDRPDKNDTEFLAILDSIKELAIQIITESPNIPSEATLQLKILKANRS
jgi:ATP-dependent Lon protease